MTRALAAMVATWCFLTLAKQIGRAEGYRDGYDDGQSFVMRSIDTMVDLAIKRKLQEASR